MSEVVRDLRKYCIEQAQKGVIDIHGEKVMELAEKYYKFITAKDN